LTDCGVEVSIDDFGTGHSSLERLRTLRVDELKIDRSFVIGMTENVVEREIVRSVIDLGRSLDYRLVAEGVETEQQAAALVELGCPTAQGYLFARPMPADDFLELVHESAAATSGQSRLPINGHREADVDPAGDDVPAVSGTRR
ncbi:MAG: EAL domain-containing protein, partial [Ilumatobacter sp.]|nr:EAL domain-containing protein [Ilumatobacter sp.]